MQVKIDVDVLQNLIDCASTPVNRRSPSEILSCLKMVARKNTLLLVGTDLYNSINLQGEAGVTEDGAICVNQDKLQKLAKKLPKEKPAVLKLKDRALTITCGKSRYTLPTLPGTDYPSLPKPKSDTVFTVSPFLLFHLLSATKYAAASGGSRPSLEGIQLTFSKNRLEAVASDGHQLAESSIKAKGSKAQVMVPETSFQSIMSFCKQFTEEDDPISVSVDKAQLFLWTQDVGCTVKLIDGTHLDSKKFIPTGINAQVKVNRALMKAALERLIVINPNTHYVEMTCTNGKFRLEATDTVHGAGVEDLPVEVVIKGDMRIGLSPHYMLSYFDASSSEWVTIDYNESETPIVFRSGEQELLGLIMPVKL